MSAVKLVIGFVRRGYSPSGGAESYLKRLARGVVDAGHSVQLYASSDWPQSDWPFGEITYLEAASALGFAEEMDRLRKLARVQCDVLVSLERIWRCDVYRAGDGVHRGWLTRRRKFELPLERFVRGLNRKHRDLLLLEKALLGEGGARRVIANSQMVRNEIVEFYSFPPEKIDLVRNGVPLEKFRFDPGLREKTRSDLKLKPDQVTLLFAGSGWERKGLLFAIEAMQLCKNRKMRLLVAGRGNRGRYKSRRVQFLGELPDLAHVYAAADIFILPTIYDPASNACLEALACGVPVITTRANGFSELIEDGVHGSIVGRANDLRKLRDAIRFWSDPARRIAARVANTECASEFDISRNVEQTLRILFQSAASAAST